MKKIYRTKRDLMMDFFPGRVNIYGASTGLHLVAELSGIAFNDELAERLWEQGVIVYPVAKHILLAKGDEEKIIMGYGHLMKEEIITGVERIRLCCAGI